MPPGQQIRLHFRPVISSELVQPGLTIYVNDFTACVIRFSSGTFLISNAKFSNFKAAVALFKSIMPYGDAAGVTSL